MNELFSQPGVIHLEFISGRARHFGPRQRNSLVVDCRRWPGEFGFRPVRKLLRICNGEINQVDGPTMDTAGGVSLMTDRERNSAIVVEIAQIGDRVSE